MESLREADENAALQAVAALAAASCEQPQDVVAIHTAALQQEMMVAALMCRDSRMVATSFKERPNRCASPASVLWPSNFNSLGVHGAFHRRLTRLYLRI